MIVIVDYGMGNLRSVQKAFEMVGSEAVISSDPGHFDRAKALVFPGQGSFPDAVRHLDEKKLMQPLREWINEDRPFLGICLGLQLLFESSEEGENVRGLGAFRGTVAKFPPGNKIPHMGWNTISRTAAGDNCPLLDGILGKAYFYFVHSYYVVPDDETLAVARTSYTVDFVSMISRGNLFAMQFHPEKSQEHGLGIIAKFCKMYA